MAWKGEKRRKTIRPSPPLGSADDDATDVMDIQLQEGQGGKEDTVFSAKDEFTVPQVAIFTRRLQSRYLPNFLESVPRMRSDEDVEALYERFIQLRCTDYNKKFPNQECNPAVLDEWDDVPYCPDPIFDWTINKNYLCYSGLNEYQLIRPARADAWEYLEWEQYSTTFSDYYTDMEYVNYCDEISKKIKWIEEYMSLQQVDRMKFSDIRWMASKQAMNIALNFSRLSAILVTRAFDEYIFTLGFNLSNLKDYDHIYFEVWKRTTKQKMTFEEALEEVHEENKFPTRKGMIEAAIKGSAYMKRKFKICMDHIRNKNAEEDGEVLKHITYAVYNKFNRPKTFVEYVKKKLEIARRLELIPGMVHSS